MILYLYNKEAMKIRSLKMKIKININKALRNEKNILANRGDIEQQKCQQILNKDMDLQCNCLYQ